MNNKQSVIYRVIHGPLWIQVIVAMVAGVALGVLLSPSGGNLVSAEAAFQIAPWIALPGNLFLAMIKMVVIPLVMTSIILGIAASHNLEFLKKVAIRIVPYFVLTTVVATSIGISLALLVEPGRYISAELVQTIMAEAPPTEVESIPEIPLHQRLVALIPANPDQAQLDQDMLAVVILAIFYGVALAAIPRSLAEHGLGFARSVQEVALKVVSWAMRLAPLAVFGLLCDITIRVGLDAITGMAFYVLTVLGGLSGLVVFYLVLVFTLGRKSPGEFLAAAREAQLLAFSTSSSAAVIPLSMKTAEERLGVRPSIAKFIVPLGATVNMDGTALYQVCAAVFLTQVFGVDLTLAQLVTLAATTVGASIGAPSTPGVGIVILATILVGIGVPPAGIALIIGVDRILDMSRTSVNVTGDLTACVIMNRWLRGAVGLEEETRDVPNTLAAAELS